jgi:hypothetical protein
MQDEKTNGEQPGLMRKRCETMADGRRYIIYYTFEKAEEPDADIVQNEMTESAEAGENV